ncbi:MAG: Lipoate-protein ligase A subunit 1 [Methanomassiliicoccales archaeon PtaU1.Bin124]|nr:MAG: Lipoate-protein ligase A subunit 1 [Methanomassiliicoccales archaeon PtaU1.Bin124]
MKKLRVIETGLADPLYCTAADQAILEARGKGEVIDTLHLYRRNSPTVSLGYFQKAEDTVDIDLATEKGITIVRRVSGGSTIFTDPGQWIYAVAFSADEVSENPLETYPDICRGVIFALREMGIQAEWKPLNDVLVNGRKISGSAQTRKHGAMLQHGTLMVSTDLELLTSLLIPREGKLRTANDLTTMERELGLPVDMDEVKVALIKGFCLALDRKAKLAGLTDKEKERIREIVSS